MTEGAKFAGGLVRLQTLAQSTTPESPHSPASPGPSEQSQCVQFCKQPGTESEAEGFHQEGIPRNVGAEMASNQTNDNNKEGEQNRLPRPSADNTQSLESVTHSQTYDKSDCELLIPESNPSDYLSDREIDTNLLGVTGTTHAMDQYPPSTDEEDAPLIGQNEPPPYEAGIYNQGYSNRAVGETPYDGDDAPLLEDSSRPLRTAVIQSNRPWYRNICLGFNKPIVAVAVMTTINLLNYIDRYTIAGVLLQVQDYYDISNAEIGLLQTAFICSYMVFSPIFGFLGDRYNRKIIMAIGIGLWSIVTFFSSFVPQQYFGLFLFARALVGIGEASYSTIAPTIIADLFVGDARTKALSVFYFAIPIGSGLGYIVGSYVAKLMGSWQWALRVTPALGILCVIMILLFVREPTRGALEGGTHLRNTSWFADLAYLVKNKSFMMSTFGFTCVAFVAGALALWTPTYVEYSIIMIGEHIMESSTVSLIFGVITCLAGFIGVAVGSESARRLRKRCERADPLVCAFGLLGSGPFVFLAVFMSRRNTIAAWIMVFLAETLLCLNWALVTDILLYIVIPTRRSTAEAVQILVSHALGDAGSPYLVGAVSDHLRKASGMPIWSTAAKASSLQNSMYIPCFVSVLGGGFFLFTALFILDDRRKAKEAVGVVNGSVSSSQSGLSTETATTETASSIQGNRSSVDKPTTVNA